MNILIPGGAGFADSNLVRRCLRDETNRVFVVDPLNPRLRSTKDNLMDVWGRIDFVEANNRNQKAIEEAVENQIFDRRVYNVLTTNSTVREIVEAIGAKVHNVDVQYVDSPIMNQLSYIVCDDRFRSLGFTYSGTLEQGIDETVQLLAGIMDTG